MADPIRPDPDAADIRTSCSRQLIVELAGRLALKDAANPDVVLKAAISRLEPPKAQGLALWKEQA